MRAAPPLTIFADRGCPFAHRALALLEHLDVAHTLRACRVGERPAGLGAHSPTGRMPLLVHGDLVLTESAVMLTYVAERFGHRGALPEDVADRARHRRAMAVFDLRVTPFLWRPLVDEAVPRFEEALDTLAEAMRVGPPGPSLLALHVAPIWYHLRHHGSDAVVDRLTRRPTLHAWLQAAADLPCVQARGDDLDRVLEDLAVARAAGDVTLPALPRPR